MNEKLLPLLRQYSFPSNASKCATLKLHFILPEVQDKLAGHLKHPPIIISPHILEFGNHNVFVDKENFVPRKHLISTIGEPGPYNLAKKVIRMFLVLVDIKEYVQLVQ